ncbi:MAG TPA: hypothetical protein VEJ36_06110 [Nitrososphaerales archaeon]|nr:hypothetical protein [Nitrososphaerales archaeon]
MYETEDDAGRALKDELSSWQPFLDALRIEDRIVMRTLFEGCFRFSEAIESSGKRYLVEPFFMTVLLLQEEKVRALESQLGALREELEEWKSKAGS